MTLIDITSTLDLSRFDLPEISEADLDAVFLKAADLVYEDIAPFLRPSVILKATDIHHQYAGYDKWLNYSAIVNMPALLDNFEKHMDKFPEMPNAVVYIDSVCNPTGCTTIKPTFPEMKSLFRNDKPLIMEAAQKFQTSASPYWTCADKWAGALILFYAFCKGVKFEDCQARFDEYVVDALD
jgi:hypothetical protein